MPRADRSRRRDPRANNVRRIEGAHTDDEVELRRELVWQLRYLQNLTIHGIQRALADLREHPIVASAATISDDLAWWADDTRRRYALENFDPRDAIGELVRGYDFIRSRSLRTMITPGTTPRDASRAAAVAVVAMAKKQELLLHVGLLRSPDAQASGRPVVTSQQARALLEAAQSPVLDAELVPAGELVVEAE